MPQTSFLTLGFASGWCPTGLKGVAGPLTWPVPRKYAVFRWGVGDPGFPKAVWEILAMKAIRNLWWLVVLAVLVLAARHALAQSAPWRVGIARVDITPKESIWMAGYAARNHPSEGVLHPLWAKALAIEDSAKQRVVLVATDLIGLNRRLSEAVAARVRQQTGLDRARIVFNSSHTHSGPVVDDVAGIAHSMQPEHEEVARRYARQLEDKLVAVIAAALADLQPARLEFGQGQATFAINRRAKRPRGFVIATNPAGPVDHSVPVLAVRNPQGELRGVLFGYACHNTTLAIYQINGDYAGFAQIALEKAHPKATSLFMIGCGADANPEPRREVEHAVQHGQALAAAVEKVLAGPMHPVEGKLAAAFDRVDLPLVPAPTEEQLRQQIAKGDIYHQRLARMLLAKLQRGEKIPESYPYPAQVVRFGKDLALVALAGEVVVDYAIRLRKEFPNQRLWVAGYCNEVFAYIPSERVLAEGGYEAGGSAVYFGLHGPFQPGLEDRIVNLVKRLMQATHP